MAFHRGRCVMHAGAAAAGVPPGSAAPGPICERALETGTGNYLANLVLYPGARTPLPPGLIAEQPGGSAVGPSCSTPKTQHPGKPVPRAGRLEFLRYLPANTQGVLVQPAGEHGVLVAATDTQRGFGRLDQACSLFSITPACAGPPTFAAIALRLSPVLSSCLYALHLLLLL